MSLIFILLQAYKVFMLGFLPGFAYMGEVDEKISCARKPKPEMLKAGSVGIAGRQTGIYPLDSPGGWQIIGRTPFELFNKKNDPLLY
jgi:inhibitor of KinA